MSVLFLCAIASTAATAMLMAQVAHRRYAKTATPGDTWNMTLFATAWSGTAAMANIAVRLLLGHLLPPPLTTSFDSAAASTITALIGAIACGSLTWTALLAHRTWTAAYRETETRNVNDDERRLAATKAVLPGPPKTETPQEARRARDSYLHAVSILFKANLLGAATGAAATMAVTTSQTAWQQTLSVIAGHSAIIAGGLSAALWLQLGTSAADGPGDNQPRNGGTPQSPSPAG